MFREILDRINDNFSGERAQALLTDLWGIDRWFDFAHFKRSAGYSAEQFQRAGLSRVESVAFPADGKTRYGDWVVPLAWDVNAAELKLSAPETLPLASYAETPCSLAMWSAPTPPGGIEAEVVELEDEVVSAGLIGAPDPALRGKILFSARPGPELKRLAARHGALGVITDYHAAYGSAQPARPPDKTSWVNAWSDDPNGWPFTRSDTPAFGFSLSPQQSQKLRDVLRGGRTVKATARVDTRLYDGSFDLVTGLIPGRLPDAEVMVFAHLYEQGAQDNAGGCAVVLEAARCLSQLIARGQLPQPRRGIRFILSWEIYGLLAYAATRPAAMGRIVAALNLDSLGVPPERCQALLELHRNPHAQSSYTDVLFQRIMEGSLAAGEWRLAPFDTTDQVIADPTIGIPTPWLGEMISSLWHSSLDTPEKTDPRALARAGTAAATYLYCVAQASTEEARWLAGEVYREASSALDQAAGATQAEGAGREPARRVRYLRDRGRQAVSSCAQLDASPESAQLLAGFERQLDEAAQRHLRSLEGVPAHPEPPPLPPARHAIAHQVPRRTVMGGLSLGSLPPEARPEAVAVTRGQNPRWAAALCCALYWVDGKRTLLEIQELAEQECGRLDFDLFDYFGFLNQHGYIEF